MKFSRLPSLVIFLFLAASFAAPRTATAATGEERPAREAEANAPPIVHRLMEAYPDSLQAALEIRARDLGRLGRNDRGESPESVFDYARRWPQRKALKVAFMGGKGTAQARKSIVEIASTWSTYCNIKFDFGFDPKKGAYNEWTTADKQYAADIRISFDRPGFWSLVGKDSRNKLLGDKMDPDGGWPHQRSMNFHGYEYNTTGLTGYAAATVLHEFGHALGLEHEHQHPTQGCNMDFRWDDDDGYLPTRDGNDQFIQDAQGRRPGIYTVLSGPPNKWPQWMVDANLRQLSDSHAYHLNTFDNKSIMKYFFEKWMFTQGAKSPCFSTTVNLVLSDGDKRRRSTRSTRSRKALPLVKTSWRAWRPAGISSDGSRRWS